LKAYLFKYKHLGGDSVYSIWKIASSKDVAFKFAFGKSPKKNEKIFKNKRGLSVEILDTEEYEVSDVFRISKLPQEEHSQGVSDNAEWML
jgi:hypothetical protein